MNRRTVITTIAATAVALLAIATPASAARTLYLADGSVGNSGQATVYSLNKNGTPTQVQRFKTGKFLNGVSLTPDGRHAFFTDYKEHGVHAYSVGADGQLSAIPGSPFVLAPDAEPYGSAATPDGKFLLVGDFMRNGVESLRIAADGSLAKVPGGFVELGIDAFPYMVAVSTDSRFAFAPDYTTDGVYSIAISPDGALTKVAPNPIPAGQDPYEVAVTPDGKYVYVPNSMASTVSGYAIGADGTLSPLPGSPFGVTTEPYGGLAISPDGRHLYSSGQGKAIDIVAIAADGTLSQQSSPYIGMFNPTLAMAPSGEFLYNATSAVEDMLTTYSVGGDGGLSPVGTPLQIDPDGAPDLQSAVVSPNQGPVAVVKTKVKNGKVTFDASGSTDSDGKVETYAWSFGDGKTETTTGKKITHEYKRAGDYEATLVLTDDEGCSNTVVFTGQTAYCNGSSAAVATVDVDAGIASPKVKAKKSQKQKGSLVVAVKAGAGEKVKVTASGSAKFKGAKVALKKAKGKAKAGKTKTLKLKAKSKRQGRTFAGMKGNARITVTLTDTAGNAVEKKLQVKLR